MAQPMWASTNPQERLRVSESKKWTNCEPEHRSMDASSGSCRKGIIRSWDLASRGRRAHAPEDRASRELGRASNATGRAASRTLRLEERIESELSLRRQVAEG